MLVFLFREFAKQTSTFQMAGTFLYRTSLRSERVRSDPSYFASTFQMAVSYLIDKYFLVSWVWGTFQRAVTFLYREMAVYSIIVKYFLFFAKQTSTFLMNYSYLIAK